MRKLVIALVVVAVLAMLAGMSMLTTGAATSSRRQNEVTKSAAPGGNSSGASGQTGSGASVPGYSTAPSAGAPSGTPVQSGYSAAPQTATSPGVTQNMRDASYGGATPYSRTSPPDTAKYESYGDNPVKLAKSDPLSTFGLDVNTTSYANVRRFLNAGALPPPDAVRIEELINYFPPATGDRPAKLLPNSPFRVAYEMAPCPWNEDNILLWLTLTAQSVDYKEAPPANLVFLVDVSGSMSPPERLPLVKSSLKMLVDKMRPRDKISLVIYASQTAVVLESMAAADKPRILAAIDDLGAGGSTAGGAGLQLAYEQAKLGFIKGGVNRVLLCTDGDFNVGVSNIAELEAMVARERESGVTLSVLGFGTDNLNDAMMTRVSAVGNGNYGYIDSLSEARKVLDEEMEATFVTVAKDAKVQIEFNPTNVLEYRQIGYEKRQLRAEDFNNDKVDAGDVGSGKRVTVLYELTPAGKKGSIDPLRYQENAPRSADDEEKATPMRKNELAYLKLRWKKPDGKTSTKAEMPLLMSEKKESFEKAGNDLRFFAAVSAYGQKLKNDPNLADTSWKTIESWTERARGKDVYRAEFVQLVKLARSLEERADATKNANAGN